LLIVVATAIVWQMARDVADSVPRMAKRAAAALGERPMFRQAIVTTACLALGGCAVFTQVPGTPLAHAAHEGNVQEIRRLVSAGADPNEYDASGQTALHWAARGGHPLGPHQCQGQAADRADVVATLIDLGANANLTDRRARIPGGASGWTPLHIALQHEQFAIAERLLARGADPRIRSHDGMTVMAMAANEGAPKQLLVSILQHTP
jgi:ankyrin repeat protein